MDYKKAKAAQGQAEDESSEDFGDPDEFEATFKVVNPRRTRETGGTGCTDATKETDDLVIAGVTLDTSLREKDLHKLCCRRAACTSLPLCFWANRRRMMLHDVCVRASLCASQCLF